MIKVTGKGIFTLALPVVLLTSCSKKIIPDKPFLSKANFRLDSLPESEINIPIQINLKPLYRMAEKNIDTVFTSPNWPDGWVNIDCANRYKYRFRRGPLQMSASGQSLNLGFTGYYKIIGSTRACAGNTVVSPWTPPCRCGFDEGERRVKVNFSNSVSILPDYKIRLAIKRQEPEPVDKCTVCFFGADITSQVMKGLKDELDFAKKAIEDSFGVVDLKPQVQQLWNKLTPSYNLYGLGWLQINPQKIRLNNLFARNDSLNVFLGLTAKPVIRFEKPADALTLVPNMDNSLAQSGFNIFLDAVLNYDSLSTILNAQIQGKQFDFQKGSVKKTVIVKDCRIYGSGNERLIIKMSFTGTNEGIVYFTGKPAYNEKNKIIEVRDIDFDIKTKNLLLSTADWIFNKRITTEITQYARFDLSGYVDTAKLLINQQLNREWMRGVKSIGLMNELKIAGFYPLSEYFIIRSNASGNLLVRVETVDFKL
jgi:hypothetical protein